VNFQCGSCGNLMDVENQFLGQPVRCPHCHEVVQTQAPVSSAHAPPQEQPPEIKVTVPSVHEQESIFQSADHAGEELFGGTSGAQLDLPGVEMPAQKTIQHPSGESILGSGPSAKGPVFSSMERLLTLPEGEMSGPAGAAPAPSEKVAHPALEESPRERATTWSALISPAPASDTAGAEGSPRSEINLFQAPADRASPTSESSASALVRASFPGNLPRPVVPAGMRGGLFIALVFIPLISYSILATIAVLILYLRPPQPSLEYLPDVDGDFPGAKKQKRASISYERLDPDSPLPDRLKIGLNQSIQLGDLEVTPERIELGRLRVRHPDQTVDVLPGEALILRLTFKNISRDVVFSPNDPYFCRAWRSSQDGKPYTFLEVGERRFYGGALPWHAGERPDERPVLERQYYQLLEPGQQFSSYICTSPDEPAGKLAGEYKGTLIWRVQVRRGLVQVGEREVPATTVIGVQFTAADIEKVQS
jgi:hypothetical protein